MAPAAIAPAVGIAPTAIAPVPIRVLGQNPFPSGKRYLAIAGAAIVLALSIATAYQLGTRSRAPAAPPEPAAPAVDHPAIEHHAIEQPPASGAKLATEPPPKPVPVRFTNPFDTSEVFEFPPGTSETAARDAVAAFLIQRARERQTPRPADPSLARRS
jgi:hypothetical protein